MAIQIPCPNPGCNRHRQPLMMRSVLAGKHVRCKECGRRFLVPGGDAGEEQERRRARRTAGMFALCGAGIFLIVVSLIVGMVSASSRKPLGSAVTAKPKEQPVAEKTKSAPKFDNAEGNLSEILKVDTPARRQCAKAKLAAQLAWQKIKDIDPGHTVGLVIKEAERLLEQGGKAESKSGFRQAEEDYLKVCEIGDRVAIIAEKRVKAKASQQFAAIARMQAKEYQVPTDLPEAWERIKALDLQADSAFTKGSFDIAQAKWNELQSISAAAAKDLEPVRFARQARASLEAEFARHDPNKLGRDGSYVWEKANAERDHAQREMNMKRFQSATTSYRAARKLIADHMATLPRKKHLAFEAGFIGFTAAALKGPREPVDPNLLAALRTIYGELGIGTTVLDSLQRDRSSSNEYVVNLIAIGAALPVERVHGKDVAAACMLGVSFSTSFNVIQAQALAPQINLPQGYLELMMTLTVSDARRAGCSEGIIRELQGIKDRIRNLPWTRDAILTLNNDLESLRQRLL